jgi:hypothetical protein
MLVSFSTRTYAEPACGKASFISTESLFLSTPALLVNPEVAAVFAKLSRADRLRTEFHGSEVLPKYAPIFCYKVPLEAEGI